jgi:trehalose 6-phosphate phosphatase
MTQGKEALKHLQEIAGLLKRGPFGLFTDLDGTLSPLVPRRQDAQVPPGVREALLALSGRLSLVAIVSGRSARDAMERVGLPGLLYVGNHGLERLWRGRVRVLREAQPYIPRLRRLAQDLKELLTLEGIDIEEKEASLAIHYRLSRDRRLARREIHRVLGELGVTEWARVLEGKAIVDILPPVEVNKGTALSSLVRGRRLRGALFLGDDLTDVDAFRALRSLSRRPTFKGFSIVVLGEESPPWLAGEADFTLWGVGEVERFLKALEECAEVL